MSNKYERVRAYYDAGFWDINRVRNAVIKKWITASEFKDITGISYKGA